MDGWLRGRPWMGGWVIRWWMVGRSPAFFSLPLALSPTGGSAQPICVASSKARPCEASKCQADPRQVGQRSRFRGFLVFGCARTFPACRVPSRTASSPASSTGFVAVVLPSLDPLHLQSPVFRQPHPQTRRSQLAWARRRFESLPIRPWGASHTSANRLGPFSTTSFRRSRDISLTMDGSSAPEQSSPPPPMEGQARTAGIGRAFKRLKTALRISGSPKRDATSPTPTAANPSTQAEQRQETPRPVLPADEALEARSAMVLPDSEASMLRLSSVNLDNLVVDNGSKSPSPPHDPATYLMDSEHRERARLLFEKYGLNFEANDLAPTPIPSSSSHRDGRVQRVEKQIRMRIRYTCHRCHTTFGATLICARCEHHRCRKCPRHPPKKPRRIHREGETTQRESDGYGDAMDVDQEARIAKRKSNSPVAVNMPQASTSESDPQSKSTLFLRRASRVCHKCKAAFSPIEAQICANCGHLGCLKCSRESGTPVDTRPDRSCSQLMSSCQRPDRIYRVPRQRIRWICDQCQTDFEPDSTVCSACLHDQCSHCTRIPDVSSLYDLVRSNSRTEPRPDKSVDLDPDPNIAASIQSHIRDFAVLHTPTIIASGSS